MVLIKFFEHEVYLYAGGKIQERKKKKKKGEEDNWIYIPIMASCHRLDRHSNTHIDIFSHNAAIIIMVNVYLFVLVGTRLLSFSELLGLMGVTDIALLNKCDEKNEYQ